MPSRSRHRKVLFVRPELTPTASHHDGAPPMLPFSGTRINCAKAPRKAVTNPTGKLMPGFSCSAVDQGEYVYDWKKTRSDHMQCEFIEFRPI